VGLCGLPCGIVWSARTSSPSAALLGTSRDKVSRAALQARGHRVAPLVFTGPVEEEEEQEKEQEQEQEQEEEGRKEAIRGSHYLWRLSRGT
jgi:hypothetical protein